MPFLLKLALWQLRGQGRKAWLFVFCIALGVAARVAVGSFMGQVDQALNREGRQLIKADLRVESRQPLTPPQREQIVETLPPGSRTQQAVRTVSMALAKGTSRLVELEGVQAGYPFYGELETAPEGPAALFGPAPVAFVQPDLLPQMGIRVGDALKLGNRSFRVAGVIVREPGLSSGIFSLGPRVLISLDELARTGLTAGGSRAQYDLLIALPGAAQAEPVAKRLREKLGAAGGRQANFGGGFSSGAGVEVSTFRDAQSQISHFFDRLSDYLRLVALMALFLGGLGIGSTVHGFVQESAESIAVLKVLGATPGRLLRLYLVQVALLGLLGSLAGVLAGVLGQGLVPLLLKGMFPFGLQASLDLPAAAWGLCLGLGASLYFSLLPLMEIGGIKPLLLIRSEEPLSRPPRRGMAWLFVAGLAVFGAVACLETRSLKVGSSFIAAFSLAGLLLFWLGRALLARLGRIRAGLGFSLRYPLAGLSQSSRQGHVTLTAMGLAALLLGVLAMYRQSLLGELKPPGKGQPRADLFVIDIQPSQVRALKDLLAARGVTSTRFSPVVKARYRSKTGTQAPVTREGEQKEFFKNREQNLSYRDQLSPDESIEAGKWMNTGGGSTALATSVSGETEASLEDWFASRLGAKLGDVLTFDVQGVEIRAKVTSIRKVRWTSFMPNFFILLSPAALKDAPQTWVASLAGLEPGRRDRLQNELVARFPNLTLIDVADTVAKVGAIMDHINQAVSFIGLFSLLAGLVVLAGMALASARQRARDMALLKVLGATQGRLLGMLSLEFTFLGAAAGLVGLIFAGFVTWLLLAWFEDLALGVPWSQLAGLLAVFSVLSGLTGVLACRRALSVKPLEALRENE